DKTGTLTHGVLTVTDVLPLAGVDRATVLETAVRLAARSTHPVDRAIVAHVRAGEARRPGEASSVQAFPGLGLTGVVAGEPAALGSPRFCESRGWLTEAVAAPTAAARTRGLQVVLVARGGRALGLITLGDALRTQAQAAIAELRAAGIRHVALLSGDHAEAAG